MIYFTSIWVILHVFGVGLGYVLFCGYNYEELWFHEKKKTMLLFLLLCSLCN